MKITALSVVQATTNDVTDVKRKIAELAQGRPSGSPRTCYHQVGLFLHANPNFRGQIWLYGVEGSNYVYHAVLTNDHARTTVDSYGQNQSLDKKVYLRKDGHQYDLLEVYDWGYKEIGASAKSLWIDRWYDNSTRHWVVQLKDNEDFEIASLTILRRVEAFAVKTIDDFMANSVRDLTKLYSDNDINLKKTRPTAT